MSNDLCHVLVFAFFMYFLNSFVPENQSDARLSGTSFFFKSKNRKNDIKL